MFLRLRRFYAQVSQGLSALVDQINQTNQQLASPAAAELHSQQTDAQNLLSIKVLQQSQLADSVSDQNTCSHKPKARRPIIKRLAIPKHRPRPFAAGFTSCLACRRKLLLARPCKLPSGRRAPRELTRLFCWRY